MFDQVIMDWTDNQVSGAARGLLDPEASQDLQALDRKVTKPVMELYLVYKFNLDSVTKSRMCWMQVFLEIMEFLVQKVILILHKYTEFCIISDPDSIRYQWVTILSLF